MMADAGRRTPDSSLPLAGVRVLDLTVVWAGPYATMMLADLGAEVIRVESLRYFPSSTRGTLQRPSKELVARQGFLGRAYPDNDPGERPWNRHAMFNAHARNKRSMTVDLERPEGREVFRRLVTVSDLLIENNSAGTLERLGLTYETLAGWRPDFILISMPAFGSSGPYKYYRGYGANAEAVAALTWLRGYPGRDPTATTGTYHMDAASGAGAAFAAIAALRHRDRTGEGQFIDFAQAENLIPQIGDVLMDLVMNGRSRTSLGNRHPAAAPHGVYPCRPGDSPHDPDRWIAIAVGSDAEFRALCRCLGRPELAADRRFATVVARRRNQDALDAVIREWTREQDYYDVFRTLQEAGVPAGPVLSDRAAYEDPALNARGFFHTVTQADCGTHRYPGFPWRFGRFPLAFRRPPVRLGEDNAYAYGELLGYSGAEIKRLEAEGHIGEAYLTQ